MTIVLSFYFTTFILGILVVNITAAPAADTMKILNECKTTEKASDDDVSQFAAQKLPNGPNAKCFMACFYEKVGVIQNEMIQPDELKSMLVKIANNSAKAMKSIDGAVNECKSIVHRERCEFASKLRSCLDKSAIIQGLNQM